MSGGRVGDQFGTQSRSTMGKDSGGDIGSKSGCAFKTGDQVRAEVSDLGTVLCIKYLSDHGTFMEGDRIEAYVKPDGVA